MSSRGASKRHHTSLRVHAPKFHSLTSHSLSYFSVVVQLQQHTRVVSFQVLAWLLAPLYHLLARASMNLHDPIVQIKRDFYFPIFTPSICLTSIIGFSQGSYLVNLHICSYPDHDYSTVREEAEFLYGRCESSPMVST